MKEVIEHMKVRDKQLASHPFFTKLSGEWSGFEEARYFAYWVMTFQDVLAMNLNKISDPTLKDVYKQHQMEDSGHDNWYLNDLNILGLKELTLRELYSKDTLPIRLAVNQIITAVLSDVCDFTRIVLVESLEESSHTLFEHTSNYMKKFSNHEKLRFFSSNHLEAEEDHEFRNGPLEVYMTEILSETKQEDVKKAVDVVYDTFTTVYSTAMALSKS